MMLPVFEIADLSFYLFYVYNKVCQFQSCVMSGAVGLNMTPN